MLDQHRLEKTGESLKEIQVSRGNDILFSPAISYALAYDRPDVLDTLLDFSTEKGLLKIENTQKGLSLSFKTCKISGSFLYKVLFIFLTGTFSINQLNNFLQQYYLSF